MKTHQYNCDLCKSQKLEGELKGLNVIHNMIPSKMEWGQPSLTSVHLCYRCLNELEHLFKQTYGR